jgi:hypothetical protein
LGRCSYGLFAGLCVPMRINGRQLPACLFNCCDQIPSFSITAYHRSFATTDWPALGGAVPGAVALRDVGMDTPIGHLDLERGPLRVPIRGQRFPDCVEGEVTAPAIEDRFDNVGSQQGEPKQSACIRLIDALIFGEFRD